MKNKTSFQLIRAVLFLTISSASFAETSLSDYQKKELIVFGMQAMGIDKGIPDVKKVLSTSEVYEIVATGINLNGFLCAELLDIRPLKMQSKYEASCIAYRGGSSRKTYIINSLEGVAFEP